MGIIDAAALGRETLEEVRTLAERARAVDGAAPFSDGVWRAVAGGHSTLALSSTGSDAALLGAAFSAEQGDRLAAELVVDPGHRRQGRGGALVRELLERTPGELWLWAHGDHPGARALAARHELERARELLQMRSDVGPGTPPPGAVVPPDGVRIRPFVIGQDEDAWLEVNNAAFSWHPEQSGQTRADIEAAESEPDFDPAGFLLAVDADDRLLGFHWTKVHPQDPNPPHDSPGGPIGEIYVLGVAPSAHGRGLGAALTAAGLRHLSDVAGVGTVQLYVEGDNTAAVHLYERMGFRRYAVDVAYRRPESP
ncbi:mycothiol synthase [Haloactinopolyspora alba]|uniref:Mycothiol acetyltransferase n=1 Tax=Haloactinopolyspora alba TaxID=648780 RepID=A0A2P8DK08_9ACTN|nr:mycothiol synthase [Haloactinopolyspora alba]PSK97560.1 mycothiol synthase [Haloactinopolyspora alba]